MAKNILILNGAARKNGSTANLIRVFTEGALSTRHQVREFYLDNMNIGGCKGCLRAGRDSNSPCSQKDDMEQIYPVFANCDVVVFASPVYFWTITGPLKTAADRLYASLECLGGGLAMYPMYDFLPLSMDKAALRAMCLALHEEYKKQNVYVGTVTVTGTIAPGEKCDPALLAEDFWKFYTDRSDCEIVH